MRSLQIAGFVSIFAASIAYIVWISMFLTAVKYTVTDQPLAAQRQVQKWVDVSFGLPAQYAIYSERKSLTDRR